MKKLIGIILVGLMILGGGPAAFARGRSGPRPRYHHGRHSQRQSRSWTSRDTFGAVCAGILGAGMIIAASSHRGAPCCYAPAYYPPPPPPPVYPRPVYYVPVYR